MITEIKKAIQSLENGEVILYPTDTVWGIGCDATEERTVSKIYDIKNREESKSLVILVDSITMLKEYVSEIPEKALEILEIAKKPTTIVYNHARGLAHNTIAADGSVAIRIPSNEFCLKLITSFGKPIVSTSANVSGYATPKTFSEISQPILDGVDYIVNLDRDKVADKSSTILKINGDDIEVIRA